MRPLFALVLLFLLNAASADDAIDSISRDILVTFENRGASATGSDFVAPYRHRKRYAISTQVRRFAKSIASEYSLQQIDHWPIRSLSVYCYVFRVPLGQDRAGVVKRLQGDARVESAQPMQEFNTGTEHLRSYNDKYVALQHGLDALGISAAHQYSRGAGVRIAVIDSNVDSKHEDLVGQIVKVAVFSDAARPVDELHGTAVTSVIGASANNNIGIVGIAPEAKIELSVACWGVNDLDSAVCDSFTLAKALDELQRDPPDILNLSLTGPHDPLLARLINSVLAEGVIIVAADPGNAQQRRFPAIHEGVIAVRSSSAQSQYARSQSEHSIFAPGEQIMVAIPGDTYDFRSGSSLAAAHVSGVIALLLASSPQQDHASVSRLLHASQSSDESGHGSVDACVVLYLAASATACTNQSFTTQSSKVQPGT